MSDVDAYDYPLPKHLIAQQPLANRTDARLMVVERATGEIVHHHIRDLPGLLRAGDALVVNETRVVPARLVGQRTSTGGRWEGLFLSADGQGNWRLLAKARGRLTPGETIDLVSSLGADALKLRLVMKDDEGVWIARPEVGRGGADNHRFTDLELLDLAGRVPLPHYIRSGEMVAADREDYQTVYARNPGSVAAPTAGLHFTSGLLGKLEQSGVAAGEAHAARRPGHVPPDQQPHARRASDARRMGPARRGGGRATQSMPAEGGPDRGGRHHFRPGAGNRGGRRRRSPPGRGKPDSSSGRGTSSAPSTRC